MTHGQPWHNMSDAQRVAGIADAIAALFDAGKATADAIVDDGWPRPMVEAGLELHRRTWDAQLVAASFRPPATPHPKTIAHLWPALPGAGVTPVMYGHLHDVDRQIVKPSRRGRHFARHFVETWNRHAGRLELAEDDSWREADHVVVSGTDETVASVERAVGARRLTGYGHRMSLAVIVDDGEPWTPLADQLAHDVVMWNQQGCFSLRHVVLVGSDPRGRELAGALAAAIAATASRWAADPTPEEALRRAQRRAVAEFETDVFGLPGQGWVELRPSWSGEWIASHAVSLSVARTLGDLSGHVVPAARHLQGVATNVPPEDRAEIERLGVTRICGPGDLQCPPADWLHDGRPNAFASAPTPRNSRGA